MKVVQVAASALVLAFMSCGPVMSASAQTAEQASVEEYTAEEMEAAYLAYAEELLADTPAIRGEIALPGAPVRLLVGDEFDFYGKAGARKILEDLWGNPPDDTVLGMIFPAGMSPTQSEWGAVLTYEASGYVSDEDAATIDYSELMREMQKFTRESNEERERLGFATVDLRGWAETPHYDTAEHRLYWAKDLVFSDSGGASTLNYDMRLLGRGGVLSINFIGGIEGLPAVRAAAPDVLEMAEFNPGQTYADYQAGDKKAGYGVAALIAGGAGAALLKKTGFIAIALAFLKKGWILIPIVLGGLWRLIGGMFRKRNSGL